LAALSRMGPQRQIDLSDVTSIDVSTLSRLVSRLVHMGLATRLRSKSSNREVTVQLTPKGAKLVGELLPIPYRWERIASATIPADDLEVTKRCLREIYRNIVEHDQHAEPVRKVDGEPVLRKRRRTGELGSGSS